jgi:hypothetical protein
MRFHALVLVLGSSCATAAWPQVGPPAPGETVLKDLVITAPAFSSDVAPLTQILPPEIELYAADTLSDLLDSLKERTRSSRSSQKPLVLINGRLAGSTELDNLPPEAVARTDILPEKASLALGLADDQLVVNFILRDRFLGDTTNLTETHATTSGGQGVAASSAFTRIDGDSLETLKLSYKDTDELLDSQRDIDLPDAAQRTLLPEKQDVKAGGAIAGRFLGVRASLESSIDWLSDKSLQGLAPASDGGLPDVLELRDRSATSHVAGQLTGLLGNFSWLASGGYDRTTTHSSSGTGVGPQGVPLFSIADSASNLAALAAAISGPLASLPAGRAIGNLKLGLQSTGFSAQTSLPGSAAQRGHLSRDVWSATSDASLPLASRDSGFLPLLGELSATLRVGVQDVSDFGTLTSSGYGMSWRPVNVFTVNAAITRLQTAPTVNELLDPAIVTPNVELFDFANDETVYATQVTGGNRDLRRSDSRLANLGLQVAPWLSGPTFTVDYEHRRVRDAIGLLPPVNAVVESAFPERFLRDAAGALLQVDDRHVNLAEEASDFVRWGTFMPFPFVKVQPGGRRILLTIYDTVYLRDTVLVRSGIPRLDLLNGSPSLLATASAPAGQPKNTVEIHAFVFDRGVGAELAGIWRAATVVDTGTSMTPQSLSFSALAAEDLRMFVDFERLPVSHSARWAKGARLTFKVGNIFNSRQVVRDAAGVTPAAFQPGYVDPLGRVLLLTVRKAF